MKLAAIGMLVTLSAVAAQEFCPAEWECDGRCFQMKAGEGLGDNASPPNDDNDGGFGKCHNKKNHPDECSDTEIWCPPHEIPSACPEAWECDGRCYQCPKKGKSYSCENPAEDDLFSPPGGSKKKRGKCKNKKDHPSKCKFGKERWCPEPTKAPTPSPTFSSTFSPTESPTYFPTDLPTDFPTDLPTAGTTASPTAAGTTASPTAAGTTASPTACVDTCTVNCVPCQGDYDTFEGGGAFDCTNYGRCNFDSEFAFCDSDSDFDASQGLYPSQVCPECRQCTILE